MDAVSQQKDKSIPVGTICQWCYNPIEKGDTYTKDSFYGYIHTDDNEFCIRTQEKVDKELERLLPKKDALPIVPPFRFPQIPLTKELQDLFDYLNKKG